MRFNLHRVDLKSRESIKRTERLHFAYHVPEPFLTLFQTILIIIKEIKMTLDGRFSQKPTCLFCIMMQDSFHRDQQCIYVTFMFFKASVWCFVHGNDSEKDVCALLISVHVNKLAGGRCKNKRKKDDWSGWSLEDSKVLSCAHFLTSECN